MHLKDMSILIFGTQKGAGLIVFRDSDHSVKGGRGLFCYVIISYIYIVINYC